MAHTTDGDFYTQAKKTKQDKFVLLARAWHLVCEMLYKFVKSVLKTYCAWPTSKNGKQTCTHGMSCKRGMHFSTPPSQPRQGVATDFLLQVQPVRVTTHLP